MCRVPGRFSAFDFIKVCPANSTEGRSGLYLCGAGPLTDESTIKELLTQGALGCTRVAIVHDLFDRSGPLVRFVNSPHAQDNCTHTIAH